MRSEQQQFLLSLARAIPYSPEALGLYIKQATRLEAMVPVVRACACSRRCCPGSTAWH